MTKLFLDDKVYYESTKLMMCGGRDRYGNVGFIYWTTKVGPVEPIEEEEFERMHEALRHNQEYLHDSKKIAYKRDRERRVEREREEEFRERHSEIFARAPSCVIPWSLWNYARTRGII